MAAPAGALPGDAEAIAKASILDSNPDDFVAVTKVCTTCHGADLFLNAPRSSARWEETYAAMSKNGARGSIDELNAVVHYMEKNLTIVNVNTSPADELAPTLQVDDATVAAILERRSAKPFTDIGDLASVRGVDRAVLEKLNSRRLLLF
jgi:cytochrome c5